MWTVYIIYSRIKDRYYTGFTGDSINERIRKHNTRHSGFTGGGSGDWELQYSETFTNKEEASKREREIKSWKSRKKIENLIGEVPSDL